jgi:Immunity protein 26
MIHKKPGDIFKVPIGDNKIKFMQFLYQDKQYLGGDVIRGFEITNNNDDEILLDNIIKSQIAFYTYTWLYMGIKDGIWERVGNHALEKELELPITFRNFINGLDDNGKIYYPKKWVILNGSKVSEIMDLSEKIKKYPIAMVFAPPNIMEWLRSGKHPLKHVE